MKTYSRKKLDSHLISDVENLCRLCLGKSETFVPIFNENETFSLSIRIMTCLGIEVFNDKWLPTGMCQACHTDLEKFYLFKKQCESVDHKLKMHLQTVQNKGLKELPVIKKQETSTKISANNSVLKSASNTTLISPPQLSKPQQSNKPSNPVQLSNPQESSNPLKVKTDQRNTHCNPEEQLATLIKTAMLVSGKIFYANDNKAMLNQAKKEDTIMEITTLDGCVLTAQLVEEGPDDEEQMLVSMPHDDSLNLGEFTQSPNTCHLCSRQCQSNVELERHLLLHGTELNRHQCAARCPFCGKVFQTAGQLRRHVRIHTGHKPYACPNCGRCFAQKEVLDRHRLVHLEKRPHQCTKCPKSFTQREALRNHERSHSAPADRPLHLHRCSLCPKVFCYASGLSRHLVLHNGTEFECADCHRRFTDKTSLRRHIKNTHAEIKIEIKKKDI